MRELIIGGARSGKSSLALQRAHHSAKPVIFVATAQALDAEMSKRIAQHRSERPNTWATMESPINLVDTLREADSRDSFIVVDCLTLWLSNLMCVNHTDESQDDVSELPAQCDALIEVINQLKGDIVLVSNEVGLGIVPDNALARWFRDEQGRLNQRVAQACDKVTLVVAGIPVPVKTPPER